MNEDLNNNILLVENLDNELKKFDFFAEYGKKLHESKLDNYDYLFSILFGMIGATITNNENIQKFLNEVHQISNRKEKIKVIDLKSFLARIFQHSGDYMDKVPIDANGKLQFVNRKAFLKNGIYQGAANGPHRVFWGHDIFSLGKDNPFLLCINQYGIGKGIVNCLQHLIADTCSKQGLPIPTHSLFDYNKSVDINGNMKVGNILLDFSQDYSEKILGKKQHGVNNEVFNKMFSIHIQDALTQGLCEALSTAYIKARKIKDEDRQIQFKIISYGSLFLGSSIIGLCKTGIPTINWPSFLALFVQTSKMYIKDTNDIKQLKNITNKLINENKKLHLMVETDLSIAENPFDEININKTIEFWENEL